MQVVRFDAAGEVLARETAPDGSVRAVATVARCGITTYTNRDGTKRRELSLPEHLFDAESLATLGGVAVTMTPPVGHPPVMLNPGNAAKYAVGHVHETIDAVPAPTEKDFGYVRVRLTGRTDAAVRMLSGDKPLFVSPGYLCPKYDATPGVHPVWGAYDAIQGPRVYNHLAVNDLPGTARGGDGMVVHMDADADFAIQDDPGIARNQETTMIQFRLDATQREISIDPLVAEVLKQEFARRDADEAAAEASATSALAKYEALKAELEGLKKQIDEAMAGMERMKGEKAAVEASVTDAKTRADAAEKRLSDPAELRKILAPRVALETTAREVLPKDQHERIDAMSDDEVKASTVAVLLPSLKLEGAKGERLDGMYQTAVATRQGRTDARPPTRDPNAKDPQASGGRTSAELHQARTDAEYVPPKRAGVK